MTVVLDEFQNAETVEPALVTDLSVLWDKYRKDTQLLLVLTVSDGAGRSMTDGRFSPLCARACGELTLRRFRPASLKRSSPSITLPGSPTTFCRSLPSQGGASRSTSKF